MKDDEIMNKCVKLYPGISRNTMKVLLTFAGNHGGDKIANLVKDLYWDKFYNDEPRGNKK